MKAERNKTIDISVEEGHAYLYIFVFDKNAFLLKGMQKTERKLLV